MVKEIDLDDVILRRISTYSPNVRVVGVNGHDVRPMEKLYKKSFIGMLPDDIDRESYNLYAMYMYYNEMPEIQRKEEFDNFFQPSDPKDVDVGKKIKLDIQKLFKPSIYDPEILVVLVGEFRSDTIRRKWMEEENKGINHQTSPIKEVRLYDYYIKFRDMSRKEREELLKSKVEIIESLKTYPTYHFFDEIDNIDIIPYEENKDELVLMRLYGYGYPYADNTFHRPLEVFSEEDTKNLLNEMIEYYDKNKPQKFKNTIPSTIAFDGNMAYFLG